MLIIFKKIFAVTMLLFCFSFTYAAYGISEGDISAASALLIDCDTGEVLFEKDAYSKRSMASTTKIMTALIAVESGKLDDIVTVDEKIYIEGTALGLDKGDKLTLKTLCYGMLLESGNDAAVLTGIHLSGSEEKFSKLMNKKAAEIGMENTNFVTASGLDDPEHYTTAYDMALLGCYAVKNDIFRDICSTRSYKAEYISPSKTRYFSNHNRLLESCEGVFGIKTGFTKKSGRCLVSACERDGKMLVAVTLNAPDDWNDHRELYEYGYSLYKAASFDDPRVSEISVIGSHKSSISVGYIGKESVSVKSDSKITVKTFLSVFYYAPVKKYDTLGKAVMYQNGIQVAERLIVATDDAPAVEPIKNTKLGIKQRFISFIEKLFKGW